MKRKRPELVAQGLSYGGIVLNGDKFMTLSGEQIRLTPMQHSLLEMFMLTDTHTLSKQEICDRLWPKKPDASDTLYTLVRRIKPIIEAHSSLKKSCIEALPRTCVRHSRSTTAFASAANSLARASPLPSR